MSEKILIISYFLNLTMLAFLVMEQLDHSVVAADLQHLFEKCGEIARVKVMVDKTGRPKGYGIEKRSICSLVEAILSGIESDQFLFCLQLCLH